MYSLKNLKRVNILNCMDMFKNSGMSIHFIATEVLSQSLEKIKANNFTVKSCLIKIVLESFI